MKPRRHGGLFNHNKVLIQRECVVATVDLTHENFHEVVTSNDIVFIDFWAPWCGPCRAFAPVYEKMSESNSDVVFAKVNTEEQHELAGHFQIRSIPTLMVFREKVIIFSQPGALPVSAFESMVQQVKELDMEQVHREINVQQEQGVATAQEKKGA